MEKLIRKVGEIFPTVLIKLYIFLQKELKWRNIHKIGLIKIKTNFYI